MIPKRRIFGGAAGYRPRVRSAYYERVYVHSSTREHGLYSALFTGCKGGVRISIRIFRRELSVAVAKRERRAKGYSKLRWPLFIQLYLLAEQFMIRPLPGGRLNAGRVFASSAAGGTCGKDIRGELAGFALKILKPRHRGRPVSRLDRIGDTPM